MKEVCTSVYERVFTGVDAFVCGDMYACGQGHVLSPDFGGKKKGGGRHRMRGKNIGAVEMKGMYSTACKSEM